MQINVSNVGQSYALRVLLGISSPETLTVRLYKTDHIPSDTDITSTYVEATFGGYSGTVLDPAGWTVPALAGGFEVVSYTLTWTCTSSPSNIFGCFCTSNSTNTLVFAARLDTPALLQVGEQFSLPISLGCTSIT